jgi:hypothetical protein
MAVAVRGVGAFTATAGTSVVVSYPATTVLNDRLFMMLGYTTTGDASPQTATTPAGWTLLGTFNLGTTLPVIYAFWQTATGSEGGTTVTVTTSSALPTWRGAICALSGIRTTGNPYANTLINGNASAATSKTTAGSLTFDTTSPSGNKYMLGFVKTNSSTNTFSLEALATMTGVSINEISDTGNGCLMVLMTCTGGTSSTFASTFSVSASWVYVLTDLVEPPSTSTGHNLTLLGVGG